DNPRRRVGYRVGEPPHGHHAIHTVRGREVERDRLRERPLGVRGVHRDAGGERQEGGGSASGIPVRKRGPAKGRPESRGAYAGAASWWRRRSGWPARAEAP